MTFKERYHYGKLALFHSRLLHCLDTTVDAGVAKAVSDCAKNNGFSEPPPLVNQAVFLQMAYVCLVWLWESAQREDAEQRLIKALFDDEFTVPPPSAWEGNRNQDPLNTLRLIRNALSHGRVQVDDDNFRFEDERPGGSDNAALTVSWAYLGQLCERVIHKLTPIVYPLVSWTSVSPTPSPTASRALSQTNEKPRIGYNL